MGRNVEVTRKPVSCVAPVSPASRKLSNADKPIDENARTSVRSSAYRGTELDGVWTLRWGLLNQIATSDDGSGIVTGWSTSRS